MNLTEIGVLSSLALNVSVAVVGATWGIAKIKDAVRDALDAHKREIDVELDALGRSFGETAQALRQKINDVELDMAKSYMRRESFYQVKGEMSSEIKEFRKELKDRLDRLETKIDSKT